ncbi:MAG: hypothetical protein ABR923_06975 [Terracidiphilus sp.]|jgi:hypothetical protein
MRTKLFACSLTGIALMLTASHAAPGQDVVASARSGATSASAAVLMGAAGAKGCSAAEAMRRTIEPYTATRKTTRVEKLANGATITHESTGMEAVDSSGRRYQKSQPEIMSNGDAQIPDLFFFNVFDPVSRTITNWSSNSKEANVFHIPQPGKIQHTSASPQNQPVPVPAFKPAQRQTKVEDLGTNTINDLEARGTRTTTTYPVGSIGNDQPLVVTSEDWRSTELGITVLQINDDPRSGVQTMELTDIERGEPDPALFQVPEGYTVKDQNPNPQN